MNHILMSLLLKIFMFWWCEETKWLDAEYLSCLFVDWCHLTHPIIHYYSRIITEWMTPVVYKAQPKTTKLNMFNLRIWWLLRTHKWPKLDSSFHLTNVISVMFVYVLLLYYVYSRINGSKQILDLVLLCKQTKWFNNVKQVNNREL